MSGGAIRYAGKLANLLKRLPADVLKTIKPDFSTGEGMLVAAQRWGPDLLFPLVAAGTAPEGTGMLNRFGIGAEDLGINLLTSVAGQYGGAKLGKKMLDRGANPKVAGYLQSAGDLSAIPIQYLAPRPLLRRSINQVSLTQQEALEAKIKAEERERYEAIINALAAGSSAASLALRPSVLSKVV